MKGLSITGIQEYVDFADMVRRISLVVTRVEDGKSILLPIGEDEVLMLISLADGGDNEKEYQSVSFGSPVSSEIEPGLQF